MNKVICDVCGTSYPETAQQCPICGCTSGEGIRVVEIEEEDAAPRTYVKGGHFSKSNVRKRNKAAAAAAAPAEREQSEQPQKDDSNKGLLIAVFTLVLAIIAVLIFIVVRFKLPTGDNKKNDTTTTQSCTDDTQAPFEDIPCTGLTLETSLVELAGVGESQVLSVTPAPAHTTDMVEFISSDPSIASVSVDGTVTAAGPGQAVITVICGEFQAKCRVVCNFDVEDETIPDITDDPEDPSEATDPSETTEPSEATDPSETTEPKDDDNTFKLNRSDITLKIDGTTYETWTLYTGSIKKSDIKWTSDNEAVAKIENGKVTAVSAGTTKVHGEYNGIKCTCIIRVKDVTPSDATDPSETTAPSETTEPADTSSTYEIWTNGARSKWGDECTLKVGEKVVLTLVGDDGKAVSVTWTPSDPNVCSVEGNTITRLKAGTVEVTCRYKGVTYTYTIR